MATQFVVYLPFGESFVDEHTSRREMPYKFSGKERDEETGLSYFGARYYDATAIIWYGVDPLAGKYPSISPYAYCLNNPIKYVDLDGREPGDFFKTVNDAAKDFGNYYNGASILRNKEFGSTIYVVKQNGKTYYTYTVARIGESTTLGREGPSFPSGDEKVVAWAHTHGAAREHWDKEDNEFSGKRGDKGWSKEKGLDAFVATPNGSLKKFDVKTEEVTTVSTDMPSDPKSPSRKNDIVPVDKPKMEIIKKVLDKMWIIPDSKP